MEPTGFAPRVPSALRRQAVGTVALVVGVVVAGSVVVGTGAAARTAVAATQGRAFYVSPRGDDAKAGTAPDEAWQTIGRVNQGEYHAGDRILFEGGARFTGTVTLTPDNMKGKNGEPVIVGSYGEGRATVASGTEPAASAITAVDVGRVHVTNLILAGANAAGGGSGVLFGTEKKRLTDVAVRDTEISGYSFAIFVNAPDVSARYEGVRIEGVVAHDNASGPTLFGHFDKAPSRKDRTYGLSDVRVTDSESFNNTGAGLPGGFGGGITLVDAERVRIEHNVVHDNGGNNPPAPGNNGPMGIVLYGGRDVVAERNEVYHQRFHPTQPTDNGGIDIWAVGAVIQRNFVHDNEGWGIILGSDPDGRGWPGRNTVVRYNVLENNGRVLPREQPLPPSMGAAILMFGALENYEISNNVMFARSVPGAEGDQRQGLVYLVDTPPERPWSRVHIRNNLFIAPDDVTLVDVPRPDAGKDLRVEGNAYIGGSDSRRVIWGDRVYEGIEAWSDATGQEVVKGKRRAVTTSLDALCPSRAVGTGDPRAYVPGEGSPLIDAGLDLRAFGGRHLATRDFFGAHVPTGHGVDIGPSEREPGTNC